MNSSTAAAFSEELHASFSGAAEAFLVTKTLRIGELVIELCFASKELCRRFLPALACVDDTAPPSADFRIHVWDSESAGVAPPRPPWSPGEIGANGVIAGDGSADFRAAFNLDSFCLSVAHPIARRGYFWTRSAATLPSYELAAPLRSVLAWAVQTRGVELAHAGCVAHEGSGVLLVGRSGSGKSTCALSCLGSELSYLADDYCALELSSRGPEAHALYRTGKLEFGHLRSRFPLLAARHPAASAGDKAILYLGVDETDSSTRSARLKAIILPVIAEVNGAKLEPTSPASAMAALGPSSVVQVPGLGATTFAFLANIVRALPCYTLRVDDPKAVPAALLALVA